MKKPVFLGRISFYRGISKVLLKFYNSVFKELANLDSKMAACYC